MDNVSVTEWPLFVWKIKNIFTIRKEMKMNCSVQGHHFNLILEQKSASSPKDEQFRLTIEELPQKSSENKVTSLIFSVRSYIIDKAEKRLLPTTKPLTFEGKGIREYIWRGIRSEVLANYPNMKQESGEIWLICIFEPLSEIHLCHPKCADRTQELTDIFADDDETTLETPWVSLDALSRDFDLLRDAPGDLRLVVEGKETCVHKSILMVRCPKLAETIVEAKKYNAKFSDLDETSFEYFLKYVYSGGLPDITDLAARKLYKFASKYQVSDLMELCAAIMTSKLNERNMCDLLRLADQYKDEGFKKSITDFILRPNILNGNEWIKFSGEHMKLALEVYRALAKMH